MSKNTARKIIVANWKMNPSTFEEANSLVLNAQIISEKNKKTDIVLCLPFVWLTDFSHKNFGKLFFGAQDLFWEESGAFTGEISPLMLQNSGVRYAIIGHSERRALGETDEMIGKKIKRAIDFGITPILCVGEKVRDSSHTYFDEVKNQLVLGLAKLSRSTVTKTIIAYEPVWSISTTPDRKDATPEDFLEMNIFIKKVLADRFKEVGKSVKIIYGGSVNEKNVASFFGVDGSSGVLVGAASLNSEKFSKIVEICNESKA